MKTNVNRGVISSPTFGDLEAKCQSAFESGGPYWHICTDGNAQEVIFTCVEDYCAAMNILAIVIHDSGVRLIAFVFMNNHVHFIMEGPSDKCIVVFLLFKKKLNIYMTRTGRAGVLSNFDCKEPISIDSLDAVRTEICYVHRNMYVVRNDILPHTWTWGSGGLYFNPTYVAKQTVRLKDISYHERREKYFFGRIQDVPDLYVCANGYVQPESFVSYKLGESFFRHASHYLNTLMKDRESFSLIAKRMGDRVVLNHEEVYAAAVSISSQNWQNSKPQTLPQESKLIIARTLHFDYKVANSAIARVLKLEQSILYELFPERV